MAADPSPASLVNRPLLTPYLIAFLTLKPIIPPNMASEENADLIINMIAVKIYDLC